MNLTVTVASLLAVLLWIAPGFAAETQRRFPVDPKTNWATGARQKPADELKKEIAAGKILIIDVREAEQFQKETIPGAINVPLEQLEGHLKKLAKETYIVFT